MTDNLIGTPGAAAGRTGTTSEPTLAEAAEFARSTLTPVEEGGLRRALDAASSQNPAEVTLAYVAATRAAPTQAAAQPAPQDRLSLAEMRQLIRENNRSDVSDELVLAVTYKESRFDPDAKARGSSATGLMQMTRTAVAEVNRVTGSSYKHSDMTDPATAIAVGSSYLQIRIDRAGGSVEAGLNGYGTGSGYATNLLSAERALRANPDNAAAILRQEIGKP